MLATVKEQGGVFVLPVDKSSRLQAQLKNGIITTQDTYFLAGVPPNCRSEEGQNHRETE